MKRLVACVLLAGFGGDAGSMVLRTSEEVRPHYVPTFIVSEVILPGQKTRYRGFWWMNLMPVPCQLQSFLGETKFTIRCYNVPDTHGDLKEIPLAVEVVNIWP